MTCICVSYEYNECRSGTSLWKRPDCTTRNEMCCHNYQLDLIPLPDIMPDISEKCLTYTSAYVYPV